MVDHPLNLQRFATDVYFSLSPPPPSVITAAVASSLAIPPRLLHSPLHSTPASVTVASSVMTEPSDVTSSAPGANPSPTASASTDELAIVIKNPTDRPGAPPFMLSAAPSSTIFQLKERLATSYPGAPPVSSQRLIYAGKLLVNASTLTSVFPTNSPSAHTIHLVVSTPASTRPTPPTPTAVPPPLANAPPPQMPPPPSDRAPVGAPDHAAYLTHLHAMERLIAQTWQTHRDATNAATAAHLAAAGAATTDALPADPTHALHLAAQLHAHAAHLDAHAAALHAHAHAHARALQAARAPAAPAAAPVGNGEQGAVPPGAPDGPGAAIGFDFRFGRFPQAGVEGAGGPAAAAAAAAGGAAEAPRVRRFVFQFELNWGLIAKLALLVYLLAQDVSTQRLYLLIAVAGAIYLWQTGHLSFMRRMVATALPNPRQLIDNLFPTPAAAPAGDEGVDGVEREAQPPQRMPHRFGRTAVVLSFVYSFVYGFVCSLLPAWNPEPHPRMNELLPPAQPQANNAQQPAAHEHAD